MLIDGDCYLLYGDPDLVEDRRRCPSQASTLIDGYCYAYLGRAETSRFANCDEARAAGVSSIPQYSADYAPYLDLDSDGVACED